jgi:hypothetical protein
MNFNSIRILNPISMKTQSQYSLLLWMILALIPASLLLSCSEKEGFAITNDLRVLKVDVDEVRADEGANELSVLATFKFTFSHALNTSAFEEAVSISPNVLLNFSYDSTNSVVTIAPNPRLDFSTAYTINLPEGSYGSNGESLVEALNYELSTDGFNPPNVMLSIESSSIEEGASSLITASIEEAITENITINFTFGGTATIGEDYTTETQSITINSGENSGSLNLSVADDDLVEGQEFIRISIISIINGKDNGQVLTVNILDDDVALELILKGVLALEWTTSGTNGGKALHFKAVEDIADLSNYAIGIANNGGGTDSIEYRFPAMAVANGDDILLSREDATLSAYFGDCISEFEHVIQSDAMTQNGDDAIELYSGTTIIEIYGDPNIDGTGEAWDYEGSWAHKLGGTWIYGGQSCATTSTTSNDSNCSYPLCANALTLQGIMSFQTGLDASNRERAIHLRANRDIADISVYGIGIANNGGGSDGREMDLPAISVQEGDNILFIRDEDAETIEAYFGSCFSKFDHTAVDAGINFNGDDGVELYLNADVIEIYGDVVDDGTGLFWEYNGSWAYKEKGDNWTYAGVDCASGFESNQASGCPYTLCDN